jgi:ABC-type multidrug transport system fused ATPase/permease subunit
VRILQKLTHALLIDFAASIDYSTERHIQQTLVSSFNDRTLLCIAHRLQTIIGFDRICVLEKGDVIEVGGVLELYQIPGGVFRGMCERAGISEDELVEAQKARRRMTDIVT